LGKRVARSINVQTGVVTGMPRRQVMSREPRPARRCTVIPHLLGALVAGTEISISRPAEPILQSA
jgi:hypothetical protein